MSGRKAGRGWRPAASGQSFPPETRGLGGPRRLPLRRLVSNHLDRRVIIPDRDSVLPDHFFHTLLMFHWQIETCFDVPPETIITISPTSAMPRGAICIRGYVSIHEDLCPDRGRRCLVPSLSLSADRRVFLLLCGGTNFLCLEIPSSCPVGHFKSFTVLFFPAFKHCRNPAGSDHAFPHLLCRFHLCSFVGIGRTNSKV
jgi:hypothetical protein